jgi:hypothetical protein
MTDAGWLRRALRSLAALAMLLGVVAGCGGDGERGSASDPRNVPITPRGPATGVNVCMLLSPGDTARTLGQTLRPVGLQYGPAKLATLECEFGRSLANPVISVTLAIGPISENVFNGAYGEAAGGDPVPVKKLGQAAVIRTEAAQQSVHVLVHGSILTLTATIDAAKPLRRSQLLDLTTAALNRLPTNPVLASTSPGDRCSHVPVRAVAAAIGAEPTLSSEFVVPDQGVTCSWSALPGAVVVTVFTSAGVVAQYQHLAARPDYQRVVLGGMRPGVDIVSRADRAGDLLIVTGQSAVVVTVEPTAGFSGPGITTTPGERALATAIATTLI